MRKIIFRDDDTSYFTRPDQLEAIYGRIWDAGHTVCLAVIPAQWGDIRVYWRDGNPFDPSIPPSYRGKEYPFSIYNNPELCEFLREKIDKNLVEICLHGYSHRFYEFITHDIHAIQEMLDLGMKTLEQAFPNATINTFIAPYDRISPTAIKEVIETRGMSLSTMSTNLTSIPELPSIKGHDYTKLTNSQWLYVCDEYFYTHRDNPQESLEQIKSSLVQNDLTIITNHYWMFYHDWEDTPNKDMMDSWNHLLDDILSDDEVQIVSFSQNESLDKT